MRELLDILNISIVTCVIMTALLLITRTPHSTTRSVSLFFIYCILCYLSIEYIPSGLLHTIILSGPFLLPFAFWLLSRQLFSDSSLSVKWYFGGAVVLSLYYIIYALNNNISNPYDIAYDLVGRGVSMVFVLMAIYEAQRGLRNDLVEKRRKIRSIFTYTISVIVLITLLGELSLSGTELVLPKVIQRAGVLIFTMYFIISNVKWKGNFFGENKVKISGLNEGLAGKIRDIVVTEKLYRTEALTIGQLADRVEDQEYKVRQAINQQLGYRNFTDFINSFRLQEAKVLLTSSETTNLTVLEIAYKVGFNSIGPFNRAFKNNTGLTPTEFRKKSLLES